MYAPFYVKNHSVPRIRNAFTCEDSVYAYIFHILE